MVNTKQIPSPSHHHIIAIISGAVPSPPHHRYRICCQLATSSRGARVPHRQIQITLAFANHGSVEGQLEGQQGSEGSGGDSDGCHRW